jgi:type II secretory pathway pseudopilin PulG
MVAMVGIIAAIAIPQFAQYRQKADKAALDSAAIEIQTAAHNYYEKTGSWPCSDADLDAPNAMHLISQKHWKIETDCNGKAAFVTYKENGKDCLKRINFADGEGTGVGKE